MNNEVKIVYEKAVRGFIQISVNGYNIGHAWRNDGNWYCRLFEIRSVNCVATFNELVDEIKSHVEKILDMLVTNNHNVVSIIPKKVREYVQYE